MSAGLPTGAEIAESYRLRRAAADDLYEALRVCVNVCSKALQEPINLNGRSPYDIAMAALAKARGEQS